MAVCDRALAPMQAAGRTRGIAWGKDGFAERLAHSHQAPPDPRGPAASLSLPVASPSPLWFRAVSSATEPRVFRSQRRELRHAWQPAAGACGPVEPVSTQGLAADRFPDGQEQYAPAVNGQPATHGRLLRDLGRGKNDWHRFRPGNPGVTPGQSDSAPRPTCGKGGGVTAVRHNL